MSMDENVKKSVIRRVNEMLSDPTMNRINSIELWMGYVESARFSPLTFKHVRGFLTPREALLDLHDSIRRSLDQCIEYGAWSKQETGEAEEDSDMDEDMQLFLSDLQPSNNNDQSAGYEFYTSMEEYGWHFCGELNDQSNFGVKLEICESAECALASKQFINKLCDKFEGVNQQKEFECSSGMLRVSFWIDCKIPPRTKE